MEKLEKTKIKKELLILNTFSFVLKICKFYSPPFLSIDAVTQKINFISNSKFKSLILKICPVYILFTTFVCIFRLIYGFYIGFGKSLNSSQICNLSFCIPLYILISCISYKLAFKTFDLCNSFNSLGDIDKRIKCKIRKK